MFGIIKKYVDRNGRVPCGRLCRGGAGFTLTEMLVSISIVAVISAITLANYHESSQVAKINSEVYKLATLIREVQDWSLGVRRDKDGNLPGAWGFGFSSQPGEEGAVSIYAYDYDREAGQLSNQRTHDTVPFAYGVEVSNLVIDATNPARGFLVFIPPDPTVLICSGNINNCNDRNLELVLSDSFSERQRSIKTNLFGLIDVE